MVVCRITVGHVLHLGIYCGTLVESLVDMMLVQVLWIGTPSPALVTILSKLQQA